MECHHFGPGIKQQATASQLRVLEHIHAYSSTLVHGHIVLKLLPKHIELCCIQQVNTHVVYSLSLRPW